ncbi:MAG: sodium:solute symporter family protein [Armatimonadetes bacterium]|nr:sodium:solute symporter family protein [Armatimonadota bacterium]
MHGMTTLDLIVVLIYLGGIAWLGIAQAGRIKSAGDYFAGGRKFNKWLMMMHSLGTGTHADDPVGVAGAAYERGISGIWYTYIYLFCTPFYWIIAPIFRRSRYLTTADFFEDRFSRGLGLLYSVMGVLIFSVNTGTMLKGTGAIATSVTHGKMPEWVAMLGMTAVFVVYGTAGGLIATIVTESVQGLLIVVMSLMLVPYGLAAVGGFHGLHSTLSPDKFSLAAPEELTLPWIIASSIAMLIGIVAQPHTMEVCASGKTEWEGRVGFTYGSFIKRFCAMGWAMTGLIVLGMVASKKLGAPLDHREAAFGTAVRELLPPGMTGLMFAAILAAQMSTLSAFMVAGSALLARNIYTRYIAPQASDEDTLRVARFAGLIVVALGVAFAFMVEGVAEALTYFWALNSLLGLCIWFAVLWRRTNAMGAWLSFGTMALIWLALGPIGAKIAPMLPGIGWLGKYGDKKLLHLLLLSYLPAGAAAILVGSLFSRTGRDVVRGLTILGVIAVAWSSLFFRFYCRGVGSGAWAPLCDAVPTSISLALVAALVSAVIGRLCRRPTDEARLDRFYRLLQTPVGREGDLGTAGVEVVYAGESTGHPWELRYPRLVNWGGFAVGMVFSFAILAMLWLLARWGG